MSTTRWRFDTVFRNKILQLNHVLLVWQWFIPTLNLSCSSDSRVKGDDQPDDQDVFPKQGWWITTRSSGTLIDCDSHVELSMHLWVTSRATLKIQDRNHDSPSLDDDLFLKWLLMTLLASILKTHLIEDTASSFLKKSRSQSVVRTLLDHQDLMRHSTEEMLVNWFLYFI